MKNYKYKFFIFIASLIIGFLASNNFNINSMSNLFKMNAQEYKNASEERNMPVSYTHLLSCNRK